MDMELKILFIICLGFVTFSITLCILIRRISELKFQLNEIKDMYRIMDSSYEIVLARTNELGDKIQELGKMTSICYKHVNDSCSALGTLISTMHDCQDKIDDISDCMNATNDAVIPVIREDYRMLTELKQKFLDVEEKETNNDD